MKSSTFITRPIEAELLTTSRHPGGNIAAGPTGYVSVEFLDHRADQRHEFRLSMLDATILMGDLQRMLSVGSPDPMIYRRDSDLPTFRR